MTLEELRKNVKNYEVNENDGPLYKYRRLQDMVYEYNDPYLNRMVSDVYKYDRLLYLFTNMAKKNAQKAVWNMWNLLDEGCNPCGYYYVDEYGDVKSIDREYLYKLKKRLLEAIYRLLEETEKGGDK